MTFALSQTPTAGTGTISVAAGSGAVTGVGTNFSGQALNGRIIIVGRINFLVTAVASKTAMTVRPAPVTDIVADSFTFVNNGVQINQTGTDTSLAGLAALPGVLVLNIGIQTIYKLGMIKLAQPTTGANLSYNANTEGLAWHPNITAPEVITGAGRTITVTGARTDGTYTANFYPRAMAFPRNGSEFLPSALAIDVGTGTFNATGVWFDANTTEQFTGSTNITDCKWTNTGKTCNMRLNSTAININGFALHSANLTLIANPARLDGVKFYNSTYVPVSLPATTEAAPRVHEGWDFQGSLPLFNNFGGNANFTEFVNLANWDGFRVATNTVLNLAMKFTKQVSFSMKNAAGANIENCIVYRLDTNNGNRTFYAADEHLILTTNASGAASGKILAQVGRLPAGYLANSTVYTATMDFRNAANNGTGNDEVFFASYDHLLSSRAINTKGNGILAIEQTIFADPNVTLDRTAAIAKLASSFTVNPTTKVVTVTANSTYDDLHDVLKAYKCTANATNLATPVRGTQFIVTPSGSQLTAFAGWTLVVNTGVTLSAGTKFDFVQFATVTLSGTGKISGLYGTSAGRSTNFELRDVKPGAAYVVATNSTKATLLYGVNNTATPQTYTVQFPPGSSGTQIYVARKAIGDFFDFEVVTLAEGLVWTTFTDIPDEGAKETSEAALNAYTALEANTKMYNYITGIYMRTEAGIKLGNFIFREGKQLKWVSPYSAKVNQSAGSLFSKSGNLFTIKASGLDADANYDTNVLTPPATMTADTNEVIGTEIVDANGDSSITIQGGSGNNEVWKVANGTPEDQYATGTLLADNVGLGKWRFSGTTGFYLLVRDKAKNNRDFCSMEKGAYTIGLFAGPSQITVAQLPEVYELQDDMALVKLVLEAMKGAGFETTTSSLHALRVAMNAKPTAAETAAAVWAAETRTLQKWAAVSTGWTVKESVFVGDGLMQILGAPMLWEPSAQTLSLKNPSTGAIYVTTQVIATSWTEDTLLPTGGYHTLLFDVAFAEDVQAGSDVVTTGLGDYVATASELALVKPALDTKPTLQQMEASTILAMKAQIEALQALINALPQAGDVVDANIVQINAKPLQGAGVPGDSFRPV